MVQPSDISSFMDKFFQSGIVDNVFKWSGYALVVAVVLGIVYFMFLLIQYRYKFRYVELKGLDIRKMRKGENIDISGLKLKKDLARPINIKGVTKWQLFFARKKIMPFSYDQIGAKNLCHAIRTGPDSFIPAKHRVDFVVGNHVVDTMIPLPVDLKFWESNEMQQAAIETVSDDAYKRYVTWTIIVISALLIFTAVTIWFNLKMSQGTVEKIDFIGNAIGSLKNVGPG